LHQHGGVRAAAAKFGARVFALSTLKLQPLAAGPALRAALSCSRVIVSSPAAVRMAHAQLALGARRGQSWYALGAGSAGALHRFGIETVRTPEHGSDSEALLALPDLSSPRGERIGLITAPGGRGLIERSLAARGAQVLKAEVYQREALPVSAARLQKLLDLGSDTALLMTSAEAFAPLWQALPPAARKRLQSRPCVVASERLEAQARALGFRRLLRASDASPSSLLAALAHRVKDGRFR
jgi:uroporphyrinogen-III synthase